MVFGRIAMNSIPISEAFHVSQEPPLGVDENLPEVRRCEDAQGSRADVDDNDTETVSGMVLSGASL